MTKLEDRIKLFQAAKLIGKAILLKDENAELALEVVNRSEFGIEEGISVMQWGIMGNHPAVYLTKAQAKELREFLQTLERSEFDA